MSTTICLYLTTQLSSLLNARVRQLIAAWVQAWFPRCNQQDYYQLNEIFADIFSVLQMFRVILVYVTSCQTLRTSWHPSVVLGERSHRQKLIILSGCASSMNKLKCSHMAKLRDFVWQESSCCWWYDAGYMLTFRANDDENKQQNQLECKESPPWRHCAIAPLRQGKWYF